MRHLIILLLFLTSLNTNAQDITLKVLGRANYVKLAESNGIIISIKENELEKKAKLSERISLIGIKNKLVPVTGRYTRNIKQFRIEEKDLNRFDQLLTICNDLKIGVRKIYYKLPEHNYKDEDKNAILALNNATSQAKIISNHLGYKIVKILNIDDETTFANPLYDNIDKTSERGQRLMELLELLGGGNSLLKTESSAPTRNGGYTLLVTYKLKKV